MRIGVDGRKVPEAVKRGPVEIFNYAREMGAQGLFFRTILDIAPTLDMGVLRAIRQRADDLDMYVEMGLGKVNPFATPETPELRAVGNGDIVLGFRRMMEACAAVDCRELWVATCNYKSAYVGRFAYDRFRTDVTWDEQLDATARFLKRLAPIARDLGIHMNLETHEEITSFELVRLVEDVGPDVTGITFDTANVLQRAEHPVWSARRVAPYVRQTHVKDAVLARNGDALDFQMRPLGDGVVDFRRLLPIIAASNPQINLSFENVQSHEERPKPTTSECKLVEYNNADWREKHPDLTEEELSDYLLLVEDCEKRLKSGAIPDTDTYGSLPFNNPETAIFVRNGISYLNKLCKELKLPVES